MSPRVLYCIFEMLKKGKNKRTIFMVTVLVPLLRLRVTQKSFAPAIVFLCFFLVGVSGRTGKSYCQIFLQLLL